MFACLSLRSFGDIGHFHQAFQPHHTVKYLSARVRNVTFSQAVGPAVQAANAEVTLAGSGTSHCECRTRSENCICTYGTRKEGGWRVEVTINLPPLTKCGTALLWRLGRLREGILDCSTSNQKPNNRVRYFMPNGLRNICM